MYNLYEIIDSIMEKEDLKVEEIPNIDLYMDQVLNIFDKFFPYNEQEQALTKTMINNYVKAGIIKPAIKKKYNKEHILMIIIICMLKREISLTEIKDAFDDFDNYEKIYKGFLRKKENLNKLTLDFLSNDIESFNKEEDRDTTEKMMDVLLLCYYSNVLSEAARLIINREKNEWNKWGKNDKGSSCCRG